MIDPVIRFLGCLVGSGLGVLIAYGIDTAVWKRERKKFYDKIDRICQENAEEWWTMLKERQNAEEHDKDDSD